MNAVTRLSATQMADIVRGGQRVAPSSNDPWTGHRVLGSSWTAQQLAVLREEGRNPDRVTRFAVPMQRPNTQNWALPPDRFLLDVPELARSRCRTRVLIVTPSGDKIWRKVK